MEELNVVFEKVKKMIVDHLGVEESQITEKTDFEDDLEADSLDIFQIISELEEEFDVTIDTDQNIKTVGDLVDHIKYEQA